MSTKGIFSKELVVEKMCHAPADLFQITDRGYIREGFYADLVLVNPNKPYQVTEGNILSTQPQVNRFADDIKRI